MSKTPSNPEQTGSERREFFRVDSDVVFDVQPVDVDTAQTHEARHVAYDGPSWQVLESLSAIDQQLQTSAQTLGRKQPDLMQHLELLNQKVELIARHSVFDAYQHLARTRISLSADGIAFKSARMLYKSSYVVIRIIFLPNFTPVITFAQIIRCESHNNSFNVAAKFHRMSTEAQQCLSKMLTKAQQRA